MASETGLDDLTLPTDRLPEGCEIPPNGPIDSHGMTRLPAGVNNPWITTLPLDVVTIHHMVVGVASVPLPDGPPLTPSGARRFIGRMIPDIAAAYAAVYAGPGEPDIRVWAVQYSTPQPLPAEQRRAYRICEFFRSGRVVALIDASDRGPCLDAVRAHIRAVMTR